jgi:hypothetical protein
MPAERNINIYQGDTYVHELNLKNSANAAINISSRSYSGQIRKRASSSTIVATFSSEITNGANGIVVFSLTSSTTANIRAGTYVYDFQEVNESVTTTILSGSASVIRQVTR